MSELNKNLNNPFFLENRNFANAYPDIEFSNNEKIVTPKEITKLFNKYFVRFNLVNKVV